MIVYLAWGSLYWNPDTLPIEHWVHSSLELPLEFSRISDQGKGRLTLVIDTINGQNNKVWYAPSKLSNVNQAINALKDRERTIIKNIAFVFMFLLLFFGRQTLSPAKFCNLFFLRFRGNIRVPLLLLFVKKLRLLAGITSSNYPAYCFGFLSTLGFWFLQGF